MRYSRFLAGLVIEQILVPQVSTCTTNFRNSAEMLDSGRVELELNPNRENGLITEETPWGRHRYQPSVSGVVSCSKSEQCIGARPDLKRPCAALIARCRHDFLDHLTQCQMGRLGDQAILSDDCLQGHCHGNSARRNGGAAVASGDDTAQFQTPPLPAHHHPTLRLALCPVHALLS